MKISIITVCFEAEETIERCVSSVLNQQISEMEYEYIIIDGASRDATMKIIRSFNNNRIKVISEPDNGIYEAMNKGISLATGSYLMFLNSDDQLFGSNTLRTVFSYLESFPDVTFFAGNVGVFKGTKVVRIIDSPKTLALKDIDWGMYPPHPGTIIRRSEIQRLGGFNTKYRIAADLDLMRRLFLNRVSYKKLDFTVNKMAIGGVSSSGSSSYFKITKELIKIHGIGYWGINSAKIYFRLIKKLRQLKIFSSSVNLD